MIVRIVPYEILSEENNGYAEDKRMGGFAMTELERQIAELSKTNLDLMRENLGLRKALQDLHEVHLCIEKRLRLEITDLLWEDHD